jgi:hypothetical protein
MHVDTAAARVVPRREFNHTSLEADHNHHDREQQHNQHQVSHAGFSTRMIR